MNNFIKLVHSLKNYRNKETVNDITVGYPLPLGSSITSKGVNFSLVATNAEYIEILLFEKEDSVAPKAIFKLDENHKTGPFYTNSQPGSSQFTVSPYDKNPIPKNYSGSSNLLNIDCASLASDDTPQFDGYIAPGMIIRGRSSRALARVTEVKLLPDQGGTLIGTFHVPDSRSSAKPIFETGTSTLKLTGSPIDSTIAGTFDTQAEGQFFSQGTVDVTQESTLSIRNAKVETDAFEENKQQVTHQTQIQFKQLVVLML